jgi:hypothetical protein
VGAINKPGNNGIDGYSLERLKEAIKARSRTANIQPGERKENEKKGQGLGPKESVRASAKKEDSIAVEEFTCWLTAVSS